RGVGFERRVGSALAAPALVEVHDAVFLRVEEAPLFRIRAPAGSAVQEDDRLACGISALLVIELVHGRYFQLPGVIRLDGWVQPGDGILADRFVGHRWKYTRLRRAEESVDVEYAPPRAHRKPGWCRSKSRTQAVTTS